MNTRIHHPPQLLILLPLFVLAGCAEHPIPFTLPAEFQEPQISDAGSIRTFAQYLEAREIDRKSFQATFEKSPESPAILLTRELAALPSLATRRYAQELAAAFRRHGTTPAAIPEAAPASPTISYDELAKVHALTALLFGYDAPFRESPPDDARLDLQRVVAVYCPCDDAAVLAVAFTLLSLSESDPPDVDTRRQWKELARLAIARTTDPRHAMNITTLSVAGFGGEFLLIYLSTIDDPTGHDWADLSAEGAQAQDRALKFDLPDEYRKAFTEGRDRIQKNDLLTGIYLARIDAHLMNIRKATPAMQQFCDAVNHRDAVAVRKFLSPAIQQQKADVFHQILGTGYDKLTFQYVAYSPLADSLMLLALVSGPSGTAKIQMELPPAPINGRWQITSISSPTPPNPALHPSPGK